MRIVQQFTESNLRAAEASGDRSLSVLDRLNRDSGEGGADSTTISGVDCSPAERWELFTRFHRYLDWKESQTGSRHGEGEDLHDEAVRVETARMLLEPVMPELEAQAVLLIETAGLHEKVLLDVAGPDLWLEAQIAAALREFLLHSVRNSLAHAFDFSRSADFLATPRISLRVGFEGESVRIRISDNGEGVDWTRLLQINAAKTGRVIDWTSFGTNAALELLCSPWISSARDRRGLGAVSGLGLMGLQSRIQDLGGELKIPERSIRGQSGFVLEAAIPCRVLGARCLRVGDSLSPSSIPADRADAPGKFRFFHRASPGWFPSVGVSRADSPDGGAREAARVMAALWRGELLPLSDLPFE